MNLVTAHSVVPLACIHRFTSDDIVVNRPERSCAPLLLYFRRQS